MKLVLVLIKRVPLNVASSSGTRFDPPDELRQPTTGALPDQQDAA